MLDTKGFIADIARVMRESIARAVEPVARRLDDLDLRLKELPAPQQGDRGRDGSNGADGKDGEPGQPGEKGDRGEAGHDGQHGRDGADGHPGADGVPGDPGLDGKDGVDGHDGQPGADGNPGRDGEPGKPGEKGADGRDGKDGRDGREGKDGASGRDAADIEPLSAIDATRAYPRGTWAKHAGGLWLARRETDGMDGWDCVVDGLASFSFEQDAGDSRSFTLRCATSSGRVEVKTARLPAMLYRGIWTERSHEPGDTVTWGGSLWHCTEQTAEKPGAGKAWQLAAKRGADGKEGEKGERGEKGQDGRHGRGI